jgi:hypothetical protein
VPAGAVAARHAGVLIAPGRGVAGLSMQTRNASNASPRPIRRKVAPKKATPMAAAGKRRQPKKACTVKPALPLPLFLTERSFAVEDPMFVVMHNRKYCNS